MSRLQFAADSAHQASFSYFDSVTNAHSNNGGPPVHLPPPVKKKGRPNTRIPQGPPDPNMPKKPMNSYNLFCAATRPAIMNDLGVKCPPKNVVAELVKRWNRISAQEKRVSSHYYSPVIQTNWTCIIEIYGPSYTAEVAV